MQRTIQGKIAAALVCLALVAAWVLALPVPVRAAVPDIVHMSGSNNQHVHVGEPIGNIAYQVGDAPTSISPTVTGLPDGVTASVINQSGGQYLITISGAPTTTVAGTFTYTITATGSGGPSETATETGTITVYAPTLHFSNVPAEMILGQYYTVPCQLTGGKPSFNYTILILFTGSTANRTMNTNAAGTAAGAAGITPTQTGNDKAFTTNLPYITVTQDAPTCTVYTDTPQTPTGFAAVDNRDGTLTFTWTPVADVKGYQIWSLIPPEAEVLGAATATVTLQKSAVASGPYQIRSFSRDSSNYEIPSPTSTAVPLTTNPLAANAASNTLAAPGSVKAGEAFKLTAAGHWPTAPDGSMISGDTRFLPTGWAVNPSGTFTESGGVYSADITIDTPGSHALTVSYRLERWDGANWQDTGDNETQTQSITVEAADSSSSSPASSSSSRPAASASSSAAASSASAASGGIPQTGDAALPAAWGGLGLLSLLGCGAAVRGKRKD